VRILNRLITDRLLLFYLATVTSLYFALVENYYLVVVEILIYLSQLNTGNRQFCTELTLKRKMLLVLSCIILLPVTIFISQDFFISNDHSFTIEVDVFIGVIVLFFIFLLVLLNSMIVKKRP
jgi:hypothetical protein